MAATHEVTEAWYQYFGDPKEDKDSRMKLTYGAEGLERIQSSHVLVSGLGALGVEVAKNICLVGA